MEKHTNIPTAATWNAADNQWELGEKNTVGKEIGIWNNWHAEGHLCRTVDYGDGTPPFRVKCFHPDGALAQEGNWYGGQKWLGTYRWIKSDNPTSEPFLSGPAEKNPMVWIAELDFIEEGVYNAQRCFDKQKQPVSSDGESLPARAESVPERAHYVNKRSSTNGIACWVAGQVDGTKGKYLGDYTEWNLNGAIIVKRVYSQDTGEVIEQHEYRNGKLNCSKVYKGDEVLQSFYHRGTDQAVVSNSLLYRNNNADCLQTFFDLEGRALYSIRNEKVNECHKRRYYNGMLVYEGIGNPDLAKAPAGVQYFYPGGATMINYTSNGDGTGLWRLYDEAGQALLTIHGRNEEAINQYNGWDKFMPAWSSYNYKTTRVDWDAIIEKFKDSHTSNITQEKINALVAPEHLKQELEKVDWENIETAMENGGEELAIAINGLLTTDEDVAAMCLDLIWDEIEHKGSIYEATYKVATIVARMYPYYSNVPAVQTRLIKFLFEVLGQSYIKQNEELYNELITALNAIAPLVLQLAGDEDELMALRAQYILLYAGRNMPETEALFIRERQRKENTSLRKAYAAYSLGALYYFTEQPEKLITHFSAAFLTETDPLVRLAMADYLVFATKQEAQDTWLAELIRALTDPDSVSDDFYSLKSFVGGYDVQEYVLMTLEYAKQEVLENNMEGVIAMLPNANSLKQVTLFKAIFRILFSNGSALTDITPIRRKALLAAAAAIDAHPNFVNHSEVFRNYNIPYDSYTLWQLANK